MMMPLFLCYCEKKNNSSALIKDHADEAEISSLLHQPARNAFGILWGGLTAPAGNASTYQRAKKIET